MELVLQMIMLVILLGFALRLSLWPRSAVAAIALLYGGLVILMGPLAAEQSKTQLHDLLLNPSLMLNISLWITIETALAIGYCFCALCPKGEVKPWLVGLLRWYPSPIVLPIIFYLLTQAMFSLTGMEFRAIGQWVALATTLGIVGLAVGAKALIPEEAIRLEVLFMCWLLALLLGVVATVNGQPVVKGSPQIFALPLGTMLAIAAALFTAGYWWARRRQRGGKHPLPIASGSALLNQEN